MTTIEPPKFLLLILTFLISFCLHAAKAASCPRNWLQKQGNCYGYFDEKLSWDEAEFECQTFGPGSHLASILSTQESALMSVYIKDKQKSLSHVWIGLQKGFPG
uniref:C-type lectin domain-containing protein n=1 Tax=Pseudonaja textilis TaxID=8673 RepID=A0A670ZMU3_PSETE